MPSISKRATGLIRELNLRDVIAMTLVGVVSLRWIPRAARMGAPSVVLWVLAWISFFLPLAAAVRALSSRYPEQGGLYAWTRAAFGPWHGFVCGWCLWVNNLFYYPSLLLFAAANALLITGDWHGAEPRLYSVIFVLTALWATVWLNVLGFSKSKWLQNIGSFGTWVPAALLIGLCAVAFARFGSATSFAPQELLPRKDILSTVSMWATVCMAFSGLEVTAFVGQEIKHPVRTIPMGVLIAGLATTAIYVLGSVSILMAVPSNALQEQSGIADAINLAAGRIGLGGFGPLTGGLLALGSLATTNCWFAGAARVPFAAGVDSVFPAIFARIHRRYRTPHVVLVVQGIVATLIFLSSLFLSVGESTHSSLQEAYDILVNLTILIYFIPYVYLFLALLRLETGGFVGRNRMVTWLVAFGGGTATIVSLALVFVPPPGTEHVMNFEVNLIGQGFGILAIGFLLYRRSKRSQRH
jgi:glutamate:GABA antiporter